MPDKQEQGQRVRVQGGLFEGVEGTVTVRVSPTRVIVTLDLEQTGVSLEIDERHLERAD